MGQQVMAEQQRLGVLEMGASRHRCALDLQGAGQQHVHQLQHLFTDRAGLVPDVQPDQGGDLVIAGTAGAQLAAELLPRPLQQAALEGGVYVLVLRGRGEGAGGDIGGELVQRCLHAGQLVDGQQPGGVQHGGVGLRAAQIVRGQGPVEVRGHRERRQGIRGTGAEAPAPEGGALCGGRGIRFRVGGHA